MDKEHKNRSGSQSNDTSEKGRGDEKKTAQPGADTSNRHTGANDRRERDDSNGGPEKNTTKKGANSI